jgi:sugar-specific transcriptional regulator TrmB
MLVKQDLINKIKDYFDLNVYETKVWLALISKGVASAGEIASLSQVPRSRAYDVLESLEKKGFAVVKIGKPVKYFGIKPKMILERLSNGVKKDAEEKINNLLKIKTTEEFIKLEEIYKGGIDPVKRETLSAALKGKSTISNFLKEIIRETEKEVIICTNAEEIKSKAKLFHQTFEILKKSNIKIKMALSGDESLIKEIEKAFAMKIKKISIDTKFFIIDRKEILFYLSKEEVEREEMAIWLNSEFFAEAFASLFEKATGFKR